MTLQQVADVLVTYWALIAAGIGFLLAARAYYRRAHVGPLWPVIGWRSLWPWGRGMAVLRAANDSTKDLYAERVLGIEPPNRYHPWENVFERADWTALRAYAEPTGTFNGEANVELTPKINQAIAGASRQGRAHVWITGEAVAGRSALLLHLFFTMLGAPEIAPGRPPARRRFVGKVRGTRRHGPEPMLLRPGHLGIGQVDVLKYAGSLEPILSAWLANRGIKIGDGPLPDLAREFEAALRAGKVIVFIDRYETFVDLGLDVPIDYLLEFPYAVISAATARADPDRSIARLPLVSERYRAGFGRFFAEHQNWLLGGTFTALEETYSSRIKAAIEDASGRTSSVYVVDIMAGGANARWKAILEDPSLTKLHLLAIDRDPRGIAELRDEQAFRGRYATWAVELHGSSRDEGALNEEGNIQRAGGLQIRKRVQATFNDPTAEVDIIVGKKALHEIKRELQPELIRECAAALRDGGRLIFFTDSMGHMEPQDRDRLEYVRAQLARSANAASPPEAVRALVLGMQFDGSDASIGLFCNLWVLLKDRANGNAHEVPNRYFASPHEITTWCNDARLEAIPVEGGGGHYRIAPRKFNEDELRKAFDFLQESGTVVDDDVEALFGNVMGRQNPWLSLLLDFTDHHLAPGGRWTALGRRLAASMDTEKWQAAKCGCTHWAEVGKLLGLVNDAAGISFDFPVHVLEFRKLAAPDRAALPGRPGIELYPEAIDEVVDDVGGTLDPFVTRAGERIIEQTPWASTWS